VPVFCVKKGFFFVESLPDLYLDVKLLLQGVGMIAVTIKPAGGTSGRDIQPTEE